MSDLFDVDGANLDLGFENLKAAESPVEQQLRITLQEMWTDYEPYADPDFRQGFARDVDGRFWEMYLGCTLLDAGRTLLPVADRQREGGQPDICVLDENRRIWIEAIAPDGGAPGPDQIMRPVPINEGGGLIAAPIRQAQLRTSGAFWTKARKISRYIEQGVIAPEDVRIIAISASRFGLYVPERPLPLIMTTLFPIGDAFLTINRDTGDVIEEGFHAAPFIQRDRNPIPRTAFLDERFADVSGVIWSRICPGNLSRQVRPITYVHNPLAQTPLPMNWGVWDREFVTTRQGDGWESNDILATEELL
ncbi:hypothetical protein [Stenotrophomonas maltophilia]|jgi:hypothetical protein|uniref:hypothetical protein n=1 Tax=Stenotrophomonas maltophilia TaxID=40324 RepID=UPI0003471C41|nr:hypothetical protein [Stenotrophomonas maltophilia]KWV49233.1 hypothetical protein AS591_12875 [Stenotrophomonas maltophilia]MBA0461920.1 hypothetical protein [Stenotrophomonas maltophilia]MBC8773223.1 hypothetical protein [Stenotrophomonas maltophilia]QJC75126.1 hypothetical protein HGN30_14625 [Stenotrophomonas maltophilia]